MAVLHPTEAQGTEWMYKNDNTWYGIVTLDKDDGSVYTRHRKAHELQIQVKGRRALVTQRGTVQIEPGDCLQSPLGTAFTSIANEENVYITILMRYPGEPKKDFGKTAEATTEEILLRARQAS